MISRTFRVHSTESSTVSNGTEPTDEANGELRAPDDEQRAAVDSPERAIAVLAGPGSGKTRVLSFRSRSSTARSRMNSQPRPRATLAFQDAARDGATCV